MVAGHSWVQVGTHRWHLLPRGASVKDPAVAVLIKHAEQLWWWQLPGHTLQGESSRRQSAVNECERQVRSLLFG